MKLLDQYIYTIGKHLPYKSRKEIKMELHSLLMDEIESTYGDNPTEADIRQAITAYGTPRAVANRYKSEHLVIGAGYTDLYFMIAKIIVFAQTIGFGTLFIISLFTDDITINAGTSIGGETSFQLFTAVTSINSILVDLVQLIGRIFMGSITGLGWLSLIFLILTRINNDQSINIEDDWTPDELKDVKIGPEIESRLESGLSIFFILAFATIINAFPQLVTVAEKAFSYSGLLDHTINIEVFRLFLIPITLLWVAEVIYHVFCLFYGNQTRNLAASKLTIDGLTTILSWIMVGSTSLYLTYTGPVGFRMIFIIAAVIGTLETISGLWKFVKYYVMGE